MFAVPRCLARHALASSILPRCERSIVTNCRSISLQLTRDKPLQQTPLTVPVLVNSCRGYAKSKGRQGSSRHGPDRPKVELNDDELAEVLKVNSFRESLSRALQRLGDSYLKQLTIGNAAANVESIMVNFDGDEVQLCEVAQIQKKPNLVVLQFTSFPEAIKPAMKAIEDSGIRASLQQEATSVYLHLPKITREQREDMAKNAKMLFQKCKDELVQTERRATKEIQNHRDGSSQDLLYNAQQQVKYEIEQTVAKAETMMKAKQKELLSDS